MQICSMDKCLSIDLPGRLAVGESPVKIFQIGETAQMAILQAIALSQMDTYRKDLLRASRDRVDEVLFNKVSSGQAAQKYFLHTQ